MIGEDEARLVGAGHFLAADLRKRAIGADDEARAQRSRLGVAFGAVMHDAQRRLRRA